MHRSGRACRADDEGFAVGKSARTESNRHPPGLQPGVETTLPCRRRMGQTTDEKSAGGRHAEVLQRGVDALWVDAAANGE